MNYTRLHVGTIQKTAIFNFIFMFKANQLSIPVRLVSAVFGNLIFLQFKC